MTKVPFLLHVREPDPDVNIISCHGKSFKKYLILNNMFYLHKKHIGKRTIGARSLFYSVDFNIHSGGQSYSYKVTPLRN